MFMEWLVSFGVLLDKEFLLCYADRGWQPIRVPGKAGLRSLPPRLPAARG